MEVLSGGFVNLNGLGLQKPQAVSFRNHLGLQWRRATTTVVACSKDCSKGGVLVDVANLKHAAAPPRRKRGRPKKKVPTTEPGSSAAESTSEEDEDEEWDFFGELDRHMKNGHGSSVEEKEHPHDVEGASQNTTSKANGCSSKGSGINGSSTTTSPEEEEEVAAAAAAAAAARASSLGGPQGNEEEQVLREDDGDDVDLDDPKYQQKPDWMQDAVWESISSQLAANEDDEGQALWVDEEDPNWPAEECEDGWGFRTSQFFDKVSIKNDKSGGDEDEDEDEELRMNWENEADDSMILEITSADWETSVFSNPTPLLVYVFARYGRRGLDSWKTLEQLETAVTKIWESNKAPLRAVKVDIGMEIDLGSALGIGKDDCPQLLFIKNGKGLYRLTEKRTSEELVQLMAHFFYNGAKPACLKTTASPETFNSVG